MNVASVFVTSVQKIRTFLPEPSTMLRLFGNAAHKAAETSKYVLENPTFIAVARFSFATSKFLRRFLE